MNIYVVSNCHAGEDSTVIGAACDLAGAEEIADRAPLPAGVGWDEWTERAGRWNRDSRRTEPPGVGMDTRFGQEIVCVPLAGMVETGELPGGLRSRVRQWAMTQPVEIVTSAPEPVRLGIASQSLNDTIQLVSEARQKIRAMNLDVSDIRAGAGAGKDYFEHVADTIPDLRGSRIQDGASMLGLPIVIDPAMRPDDVRIGSVTYTIGTGTNGIPEGTVIRVDRDALSAYPSEAVDRFTTPPD